MTENVRPRIKFQREGQPPKASVGPLGEWIDMMLIKKDLKIYEFAERIGRKVGVVVQWRRTGRYALDSMMYLLDIGSEKLHLTSEEQEQIGIVVARHIRFMDEQNIRLITFSRNVDNPTLEAPPKPVKKEQNKDFPEEYSVVGSQNARDLARIEIPDRELPNHIDSLWNSDRIEE